MRTLGEKRFELLQALRFLGSPGWEATQAVLNTTEESIDTQLADAKGKIKEYRDGLQTRPHV